jgi:O-antigen/teichoic acid export membrane protein
MTAPTINQRSSFFSNVVKLVSGTTLAQAITILTAPIISRLFAPQSFGVLNVFTSLIGIVSIVICLRYEYAIMLPEDDTDAINIFALCLIIAFGISATAGVILLIVGHPLVNLLKSPDFYRFLWLIPIALLIQGFFSALNYWNSRTKHFGRLSIARVSASITTSALPIGSAFIGNASAAILVFSYMAGTLVFTSVLGAQVLKENGALFIRTIHGSRILANLKRYRKFPLVDSWSSFINNLSWQLPSLMLLYFFSETVVGYYSLSNRIILLPMTLLGSALAQVFYQRTAELRSNPEKLSKSVELVFRRLAAVGLFPAVVLGIAGPELFRIIFGANWLEAGRYAQILSPWMFILFISSPLSILFATLERQELALIVNSIILGSRIAALVIGGLTHNIFLALIIWSASGVLVYGGLALWLLKLTHVRWVTALRTVSQYVLYATIPAVLLGVIKKPLAPSPIWLLVLTTGVTLAYYAIILVKDRSLRDYLFALLPQRMSHQG